MRLKSDAMINCCAKFSKGYRRRPRVWVRRGSCACIQFIAIERAGPFSLYCVAPHAWQEFIVVIVAGGLSEISLMRIEWFKNADHNIGTSHRRNEVIFQGNGNAIDHPWNAFFFSFLVRSIGRTFKSFMHRWPRTLQSIVILWCPLAFYVSGVCRHAWIEQKIECKWSTKWREKKINGKKMHWIASDRQSTWQFD